VYDAILEHSPSSIVITDRNGIVEYVNSQFTDFTGYMSEEVIGKRSAFFESPYHTEVFYDEMWGRISSGKISKG